MVRNILDALLDYKAAHVVNAAAQFGGLVRATALRGGIKPILVVNFILASAMLLYNATQLPAAIECRQYPLIGLILFALAILIASVCLMAHLDRVRCQFSSMHSSHAVRSDVPDAADVKSLHPLAACVYA